MFEKGDLSQVREGPSHNSAQQIKDVENFLIFQDPFAWYQFNLIPKPKPPTGVSNDQFDQSLTSKKLTDAQREIKTYKGGKPQNPPSSEALTAIPFTSNHSKPQPERGSGESLASQFDDLIFWMREKFPQFPFIEKYEKRISDLNPRESPLVVIFISKKGATGDRSTTFSEKVAEALKVRGAEVQYLDQIDRQSDQTIDFSRLKLVIAESALAELFDDDHARTFEKIPFLQVNWALCADDMAKKAVLWKEIKRHLRKGA